MRRLLAVPVAALLVFCGLGISACQAGFPAGNTSDICSAAPIKVTNKQPKIEPSPSQSGITAYLQSGKAVYARETTRIVWFVQNDAAGPNLQIVAGINLEGTHFSRTVPKTNVSGGQSVYDSRIVFPKAGCWGVVATTGSTQGSFDLDVRASPRSTE
ncbi:MAG: hypothetical protein J2P38_07770 [Candidatus Dormibacteraeota bacterium]|nr:hypothetical protein [Candidatus Dormibacteraeota bacterium]